MATRGGIAIGPLLGGAIAGALGYRPIFIVTTFLFLSGKLLVRYGIEETVKSLMEVRRRAGGFFSGWRHVLGASGVKSTYSVRLLAEFTTLLIFPVILLFIQSLLPNSVRINTVTGLMTGIAAAATTATAIYAGRLGDPIGHRRILRASALLAGLLYLSLALLANWGQPDESGGLRLNVGG